MHCGHNRGKCALAITALSTLLLTPLEQIVYIDGIETRAIVDLGAAVSILRCNETGTVRNQHKRQHQFRVVVANSPTFMIIRQKTVSITIDGVAVRHEFLLPPDIKWPAIVGCDLMRRHNVVVAFDQGGGTVTLRPNQVTDVDVDSVALEPPEQPTMIDDVLPKDMNHELHERLREILRPFHTTLTWADQAIRRTNVVQHAIGTGDAHPRRLLARRIPFHFREEPGALIEKSLTRGITTSPWGAPVSLVKKKDGSNRLCIDYLQLNAVTVRDSFPLPRMDELLQALAGKRWFAILDLSGSYWKIEVKPEDRHKTASILPSGLFEFTTLPMGLANAAATCQRVMQQALQGLLGQHYLVYLDDVIVFGETQDELLSNLSLVLQRYQQAGLTLNPKKCVFLQDSLPFLGHIVSAEGLATDPEKVQAVIEWPTPTSGEETRSFLGLAGYYRAVIPS